MNIDAPIPVIPPVSVAPAAQAQAVIAPEPTDRWTALKKIGWWKPFDSILVAALLAHLITGIFFIVFGKMTATVAIIGLLQMLVILGAWCVALVYRCMDFVLQMRATMELLPIDAARLAVGYMQGGQLPQR